jgi:hypothetical protein
MSLLIALSQMKLIIDDSSKVYQLLKGINTLELDVCKAQLMASPSLRDDFAATAVEGCESSIECV